MNKLLILIVLLVSALPAFAQEMTATAPAGQTPTGLLFHGTQGQVLGPLTLPAGLYQARVVTIGGFIAQLTVSEGQCETGLNLNYLFFLSRGQANGTEALITSQGCEAVIEIKGVTAGWEFEITPLSLQRETPSPTTTPASIVVNLCEGKSAEECAQLRAELQALSEQLNIPCPQAAQDWYDSIDALRLIRTVNAVLDSNNASTSVQTQALNNFLTEARTQIHVNDIPSCALDVAQEYVEAMASIGEMLVAFLEGRIEDQLKALARFNRQIGTFRAHVEALGVVVIPDAGEMFQIK